ncbi:class I SAM-dependent methyltransferase [Lentzea jiangxiensis]|uniref:Ubiquinone/menaquinone biosynthesis C-methylase UbiE n=1 Tax=Lentzea jiangxiensis TaxID=641025 RepID=A0A1H0W4M2_9PSEU|nr:class I SAM-dependent methyltransferase [Lentzea jiangxiensis]SDP85533.1 Ubiquinone/menaquinone biosynthesis C-methylase UbiE [Lentzea jiangxiensis]
MTFDGETAERLAKSFGAEAARYDRTRPTYPDELVRKIVAASPGPRVVDVGCGTGVLSRPLAAAGCDVLGVEHDERMAEFARATGVTVEVSEFETWDPAGREFDAVVAGQSWHWVGAEAGPAQVARVLRPGGVFVALWHVFGTPEPIADAFVAAYAKVAPQLPHRVGHSYAEAFESYQAGCVRTGEAFAATGAFSTAEQWRADWERTSTTAEYLDLMRTMSPMALLSAEQGTELLDDVGHAIDAIGGEITMRYSTLAVAVTRV